MRNNLTTKVCKQQINSNSIIGLHNLRTPTSSNNTVSRIQWVKLASLVNRYGLVTRSHKVWCSLKLLICWVKAPKIFKIKLSLRLISLKTSLLTWTSQRWNKPIWARCSTDPWTTWWAWISLESSDSNRPRSRLMILSWCGCSWSKRIIKNSHIKTHNMRSLSWAKMEPTNTTVSTSFSVNMCERQPLALILLSIIQKRILTRWCTREEQQIHLPLVIARKCALPQARSSRQNSFKVASIPVTQKRLQVETKKLWKQTRSPVRGKCSPLAPSSKSQQQRLWTKYTNKHFPQGNNRMRAKFHCNPNLNTTESNPINTIPRRVEKFKLMPLLDKALSYTRKEKLPRYSKTISLLIHRCSIINTRYSSQRSTMSSNRMWRTITEASHIAHSAAQLNRKPQLSLTALQRSSNLPQVGSPKLLHRVPQINNWYSS